MTSLQDSVTLGPSITLALRIHESLPTDCKLLNSEEDIQFILDQIKGVTDSVRFKRLFQMTKDGIRAIEFHRRCDNKGPTITLMRTSSGIICGGFVRTAWRSLNRSVQDDDCVLFRLTKHKDVRFS